ncbi:hypothetical protein TNCV_3090221 [Trichonephila clavipes]|nr:hypothetical protein TNCV_3090221 [Trichonephila clavipes]
MFLFLNVPAGWRSCFCAGLVRLSLWVRPQPKSMDFHDAENRQHPCRMITHHVKDTLGAQGKIKFLVRFRIVSAQVPCWEETQPQNYLQRLVYHLYIWCRTKKRYR